MVQPAVSWMRRNWKRAVLGTVLSGTLLGYFALTLPVIPYMITDLKEKQRTAQDDALEHIKTLWGFLVWFPKNKVRDLLGGDREQKLFIVNKAKQRIFIYDADKNLELIIPTSTGRHQGTKTEYEQKVTPPGQYIAVRRFNQKDLRTWFGHKKAPEYGNGMLLFLGHWFPNIAVHGTLPEWEKYLGHERSLGCPRVGRAAMGYLLDHAAIGTKMVVHEYAILPLEVQPMFSFTDYARQEGLTSTAQLEKAKRFFLDNNPHARSLDNLVTGAPYFFKDYNGDGRIGN